MDEKIKPQKVECELVYSTEELFKDGEKKPTQYCDFFLTDFRYHLAIPRKPNSLIRQIKKFQRGGKVNRAYSNGSNSMMTIDLPTESEKALIREKAIKGLY